MADGHYYLVHFPDGTTSIANAGDVVDVGTEILIGWVVSEPPKLHEQEIEGTPISYYVWVEPKPEEPEIELESR